MKTGSTTQWFDSGRFSRDSKTFRFRGPASRIASWGGPFTIMKGVSTNLQYSFELDVKSQTIERVKQNN